MLLYSHHVKERTFGFWFFGFFFFKQSLNTKMASLPNLASKQLSSAILVKEMGKTRHSEPHPPATNFTTFITRHTPPIILVKTRERTLSCLVFLYKNTKKVQKEISADFAKRNYDRHLLSHVLFNTARCVSGYEYIKRCRHASICAT